MYCLTQGRQEARCPGLLDSVVTLLMSGFDVSSAVSASSRRAERHSPDWQNFRIYCGGSQSVAIDQDYNGWEKGTDKKSQIRSFS